MASDERLGTLIDSLDLQENRDAVGFFYVFWGVMNVLGVWIFTLVWTSSAFWVVWIPCGVVIMLAMLQVKFRHEGRVLFKAMTIPYIWLALLAVLPLLIWVFPEVLHLYPSDWVFSLTAAWVSIGVYTTGAHLGRPVIAWGSLAFGLGAVLFFLIPEYHPWIFTGANALGLIVPGLVSDLDQRR